MESRVHRLERLFCYILLAFVGFVDLIHGSLSGDDSRGTSRSSSNTTTNGSNSNGTGSSGNSSGEGRGSDNNSNNNDNNRNNNNNNNNNNNGNQANNSGEDAFRPVLVGQHPLPDHPHHPHHLQPATPLHHQQQQQEQQYKNLVDSGLFLHLDLNKDEKKVSQPVSIISFTRPTQNPTNLTSDDRGQIFRDVTSDNNDGNGTVSRVATKKVANVAHLLWLPDDKSHLQQKRPQHVAITRHRRQATLYKKTNKTNKKVYFNNTRDPYEILNATQVKINVKIHNTESNKREQNYFLYNTTKQSENRIKKRPDMLQSDQAVTVRNVDSALLTKREQYGDFNPPLQISFLKKPPSHDVSETGHTLTYECEVDTSNLTVDPEIYWTIPDRITKEKKGPEDLYPGEFRHDVYVDNNHTLIIKNVQMEHRGMYICVASVGQVTEMVTMVLRVMRVSGYDLFVRLIVGFSVAFVVIVGFGSVWMVLRVLNNRKRRAEEENGPTETTEIRRPTPDVHYFL